VYMRNIQHRQHDLLTAMMHTAIHLIRAGNSGLILSILVFQSHLHSLIQTVELGRVLVS